MNERELASYLTLPSFSYLYVFKLPIFPPLCRHTTSSYLYIVLLLYYQTKFNETCVQSNEYTTQRKSRRRKRKLYYRCSHFLFNWKELLLKIHLFILCSGKIGITCREMKMFFANMIRIRITFIRFICKIPKSFKSNKKCKVY